MGPEFLADPAAGLRRSCCAVAGLGYGSQQVRYCTHTFLGVGDAQERGELGEGRA
ncbi:MAG: hypothetical protein ACRDRP_19490 [Pseudonocardiaceae bacterium]